MEGRIRSRRSRFSQISNGAIDSLDPVSLWLYVKMYSKANIPEFKLYKKYIEQVAKENGVGRDRFNRAWALLIKEGYIKQYRFQNEKGHFYYEYEVLDEPEPAEEDPEKAEEKKEEKKDKPDKAPDHSGEPEDPSPLYGYPYSGHPHNGNLYPINNTRKNNTGINNTLSSSSSPSCDKQQDEDDKADMELHYSWVMINVPKSVGADKSYSSLAVIETIQRAAEKEPTDETKVQLISRASSAYRRREVSSGTGDMIKKPFSYFLKLVEEETRKGNTGDSGNAGKQADLSANNRFHNFHQREYDYDQLEKDLLMVQW